jgi:hypothetical protein
MSKDARRLLDKFAIGYMSIFVLSVMTLYVLEQDFEASSIRSVLQYGMVGVCVIFFYWTYRDYKEGHVFLGPQTIWKYSNPKLFWLALFTNITLLTTVIIALAYELITH